MKKFNIGFKNTPAYDRMKRFLCSYVSCKSVCDNYLQDIECGLVDGLERRCRDSFYRECKERCDSVERFISLLELDRDERQLFYLHYICGDTIERASEKMYVSRSTVFRINTRAEIKALAAYLKLENGGYTENIS